MPLLHAAFDQRRFSHLQKIVALFCGAQALKQATISEVVDTVKKKPGGPRTKMMHIYHCALEDKEFEFPLTIDLSEKNGFNTVVGTAISSISDTILKQVSPVKCISCGSAVAVQLLHHPMLFDKVHPPRIEDLPQPICGKAECSRAAHESFLDMMRTAAPTTEERHACFNCWRAPTTTTPLMQCSRCKVAKYCNAECQRAHWPQHKIICQAPGATASK